MFIIWGGMIKSIKVYAHYHTILRKLLKIATQYTKKSETLIRVQLLGSVKAFNNIMYRYEISDVVTCSQAHAHLEIRQLHTCSPSSGR